jgi:His-Xaa-Ser system radical SAM maturase HxsC
MDPTGKITVLFDISSNDNAILVTNRCNCSCIMCPQPPDKDPENIFEQSLLLTSLIKNKMRGHLGITGGEPTVLGENLIRIIESARKNLPNTIITLLTNGKKLSDFEFTKTIVNSGWPNLRIEVPLYSDNDETHDFIVGANGSFYETMEGLHNLALLRQPVGLRTVLHAKTVSRLGQYSEFIYRNLPFVFQVAFMGMETTGNAQDNLERLWVDPFDYRELLSAAVHHLSRRNVPVSIYNHQLCLLPSDLWPFARKSISTWKEKYLDACECCYLKSACGGIFGTNYKNSAFIHPLSQRDIPPAWGNKMNNLPFGK